MRYLKHSNGLMWVASLLLLFTVSNASAQMHVEQSSATSPLEVVISHPDTSGAASSGIVVITIANRSSEAVLLPKWRTPIKGPISGRQRGAILEVTDTAGTPVAYTGVFIDERPDPADPMRSFIRIEPGQTISDEIDVSQDYDIRPGQDYFIGYTQTYGGDELLSEDKLAQHAVKSNVLNVRTDTRSTRGRPLSLQ